MHRFALLLIAFVVPMLSPAAVNAQHLVRPNFSEFSVAYPKAPESRVVGYTGNDGNDGSALQTELAIGNSMLKAEFVRIDDIRPIDSTSDAQIRQQMLDYMRHNGLKSSDVSVKQDGKIRIATGRCTKILRIEGKEVPTTYMMRTYYGRRSVLMIYVGAPSIDYPTDAITEFLNSVRY